MNKAPRPRQHGYIGPAVAYGTKSRKQAKDGGTYDNESSEGGCHHVWGCIWGLESRWERDVREEVKVEEGWEKVEEEPG